MTRGAVTIVGWKAFVATITFLAVATLVYHDMPDKRPLQVVCTIVLLLTPALIFGSIGFTIGRELGYDRGVNEANALAEESWELDRQMRHQPAPINSKTMTERSTVTEGAPSDALAVSELQDRITESRLYGRLGELAHATQDRFWNINGGFDPSNRDSFTSQQVIFDWIKEQASRTSGSISDADAKAVEKVACPIKR